MRTALPNNTLSISGGGVGVPANELSGEQDRLEEGGGEESGLELLESMSAVVVVERKGAGGKSDAGPGRMLAIGQCHHTSDNNNA